MTTPATLSTVPAQTPYIQYVATSGQTVFPYPFEITQDSDLVVVANGVTLATDSGYTVSGVGASTGGNATFTSGRAAGDIITLFRDIAISRVSQIAQNSGFSSTVFNAEYNNIYLLLQQLQQNIDQCLQVPNTNNPAPTVSLAPANYANKYLAFDANGNPTPAALTSSGSLTQAIIAGLFQPQTAAEIAAGVMPTNYAYAPGDVRRYGADPTGVADSTTALQNWIKTCESDTIGGATLARLPAGVYKISNTIKFTRRFVRILGDGPEMTSIQMTGVAADVFSLTLPASGYWQPIIEGFSIDSDATSLYGFNLSALTGGTDEMYRFAFRDLYTYTGKAAIYCSNAFAGVFENWHAGSANGHCFMVSCGPGVVWNACYATNVGTGKAGFRLLGEILMLGCNGINSGDFWGVFGQDPTAGDGFSNDFPGITDYPAVQMFNCNVETFAQSTNTAYGIELHNSFKLFRIEGGKIDRNAYATQYGGIIRCRLGPFNSGEQLHVGPAILFQGSGVAKGPSGAVASGCEFYADASGTYFEDSIGTLVKAGYTGFYSVAFGAQLPFLTKAAAIDVYQDEAYAFNAIAPRRLTLAMERFAEPAPLTPVGAAQAIDITGYTKVIVTPAAAASISSATFTQTLGAGLDYRRNGRLIIEAGNANLTINHSAAGAYTFFLTGAANITLTAGQVIQFLWSETNGRWQQI